MYDCTVGALVPIGRALTNKKPTVCLVSCVGSVPEEEQAEKSAKISSSAKTSAEEAVHDVVKDDTE